MDLSDVPTSDLADELGKRNGTGIIIAALVFGILIGCLLIIIALVILHPEPFFIDCGCGAQSEMARQCFDSGNLSSWQCGVFK